jgi:hypothetical protein
MKKPLTQKKIAAIESWWNNESFGGRVLALNTLGIVGDVAKEYADHIFTLIPEDVQNLIIGAAK